MKKLLILTLLISIPAIADTVTTQWEAGTPYVERGAKAIDNVDGDITSRIIITGTVNSGVIGTYTVTYKATDLAGNSGYGTRNVLVKDTRPPIITLKGLNPVSIVKGSSLALVELGATALDSFEGALVPTRTGAINVDVPGTYVLTYNVQDSSGNKATPVTRTVIVTAPVDTMPPVVTVTP